MELREFLLWIANAGGGIVVISWLLERMNWYQAFAPQTKQWVFFGFSFFVSVVAFAVLNYVPAEIVEAITPYFGLLYATFSSVFIGTTFHKIDKISVIK